MSSLDPKGLPSTPDMIINDEDEKNIEYSPERGEEIGSFVNYLTGNMISAVIADDNTLRWTDAVFAAGLAVRALAGVAAMMTQRDTGREVLSKQLEEIISRLLAQSSTVKVELIKLEFEEEADAFINSAKNGFH